MGALDDDVEDDVFDEAAMSASGPASASGSSGPRSGPANASGVLAESKGHCASADRPKWVTTPMPMSIETGSRAHELHAHAEWTLSN